MSIWEIIFPYTCVNCQRIGEPLCANCFLTKFDRSLPSCYICKRLSSSFVTHKKCSHIIDKMVILWKYDDVAKQFMSRYKFEYSKRSLNEIRPYLTERLHEVRGSLGVMMLAHTPKSVTSGLSQANAQEPKIVHLYPIPTHRYRINQRGFDHTALLADLIRNILQLDCEKNILERVIDNQKQSGLSKHLRVVNSESLFRTTSQLREVEYGAHVILIDDVLTTGATMQSAALSIHTERPDLIISGMALFRGQKARWPDIEPPASDP